MRSIQAWFGSGSGKVEQAEINNSEPATNNARMAKLPLGEIVLERNGVERVRQSRMLRLFLMQRSGLGALDRIFTRLVPLLAALLLNGCSNAAYYGQLAQGQWQLLRARQPVEQVLADPATPAPLRAHLQQAEQARLFASQQLKLPDNRSYRVYADLGRPYVVWNVFATPELSLQPVTHCFPIAGCVAYRGYYQQGAARGAAALMRQDGLDVYVGGVEAYSTLGWFDDPILSSMVERIEAMDFCSVIGGRLYSSFSRLFQSALGIFVPELVSVALSVKSCDFNN